MADPDRGHNERNDGSRQRVADLATSLGADELGLEVDEAWTVGALLGHMAFWDLRIVTALERWGPDGSGPFPTYYDDAVDWINDAAKPIVSALEPRAAARVAIEAAEAADGAVANMSDELLAKNAETGLYINPDRADHRLEHLDEIETLLS